MKMVKKNIVKKEKYYDSVLLLRVSQKAQEFEGVKEVAVVMGTDSNKEILKELGLYDETLDSTTPNDLIISIDAEEDKLDELVVKIEQELTSRRQELEEEYFPKSLETALESLPDANLLSISIPGEHAYREAKDGIKRGLNLFIFSSNVPLEKERELKEKGKEKGLLIMGPDCGTAIINGKILGFGNVVEKGPIGVVAASGSGTQEVTSLMQMMGVGITHAIGTGGNDLDESIGGITMLEAIKMLEEDQATKSILLVSKPPSPDVTDKILDYMKDNVSKPVIINFLGGDLDKIEKAGYIAARTLDMAAVKTVNHVKGDNFAEKFYEWDLEHLSGMAEEEWSKLGEGQKYIRGLYAGGTLSSEAQVLLRDLIGDAFSNSPLNPDFKLENPRKSKEHSFVDMGGEQFVEGRPHPMIDPTQRKQRILDEADDNEVAVILLDIVIGYGSHDDPAGALVDSIKEARKKAEEDGRHLSFVASVTGTDKDPQNRTEQEEILEKIGVLVLPSNAQASAVAGMIATRGEGIDVFEEYGRD
ncbi:acyl-CoA synthetase FdrA [Candidatus Bathyarchaeota archaeon]|nr:acyl-CoA synthetase FdrA [Candidatus Bathyarchaeota archaeon]